MPTLKFLGFICIFTILFSPPVFAQSESSHVSTFHSDYGLKLLKEDDLAQATDQFIQALFFAPSNKVAKEKLLLIAQKDGFESKNIRMQISRFVELADYITFLRERTKDLEEKNTTNIEFLLEQTKAADPAQTQIKEIRNQIENRKISLVPRPEEIQSQYWDRGTKLVKINKYFLETKESLLDQFSFVLSVYERLNSLKGQVAVAHNEGQRQELTGRYESQLAAMKKQLVERDKTLKRQETQARLLQKDLTTARSDFAYVSSKMEETLKKVNEVNKKLASASLQVYEKDALLAEKTNLSQKLTTDLNDAKERWDLVQKIIQEKDEQIKGLEDKTAGLASTGLAAVGSDEKMVTLHDNLSALQKRMDEQEKKNRETVSSLRKEFSLLHEQYAQLDTASQAKDLVIERLKSEVTLRSRKLANIAGFFDVYDNDITQLNGIVEIYRGKLSATHTLLQDKEKKLINLEKEIANLKEKVNQQQQTNLRATPGVAMGILDDATILHSAKENLERLQGHLSEAQRNDEGY